MSVDHRTVAEGILDDLAACDDREMTDVNEYALRTAAVHAQLAVAAELARLVEARHE